jgi:hypothetical protein
MKTFSLLIITRIDRNVTSTVATFDSEKEALAAQTQIKIYDSSQRASCTLVALTLFKPAQP